MNKLLKNDIDEFFTKVPNEIITDLEISAPALRVYCYLFSKPTGWKVINADIQKQLGISKAHTLAKYFNELISAGWISRTVRKHPINKNLNHGYDYTIHFIPTKSSDEKPSDDNAVNDSSSDMPIKDRDDLAEIFENKEVDVPTEMSNCGHAADRQSPQMGIHNKNNKINKKDNMLGLVNFSVVDSEIYFMKIATNANVNVMSLHCAYEELQDLKVFSDPQKLLDTAIAICQHKDRKSVRIPSIPGSYLLYEKVDRNRDGDLNVGQVIYLSTMLEELNQTHNFDYFQILQWTDFQLEQPEFHFQGKDFIHACNAIRSILKTPGKQGYLKPKGFKNYADYAVA